MTENLLNLKIHKLANESTLPTDAGNTDIYLVPDDGSHGNITNEGELAAASCVVVTDSSKKITTSTNITTTELGYLDGVTSNIQSQLDGKAAALTNSAGDCKASLEYDDTLQAIKFVFN